MFTFDGGYVTSLRETCTNLFSCISSCNSKENEWLYIHVMYISFCQFKGEHAPSIKVGEEIRKILHMF
jgi:hypothetical protein